ncbi:3-dehydroquinate synthase [Candidatus Wirthbacteria bacterium CG2_30_54_11]|uniref:3-dehydroquinate synthase n=1 Tax=Candidatus Wirthbacteria bacterium CG2_30_54_11 TaxID=1817892 RepID=A0A1J5IEY3_9BACT|nr:MAG: 3-dehydroquinate synthase [Candidatus Wirthbacteria bacterium CG2_30_54_11]
MEKILVQVRAVEDTTYEVVVGNDLFATVAADLAGGLVPQVNRYVIITDETVDSYWGPELLSFLRGQRLKTDWLTFPEGEVSKTRKTKQKLEDALAKLNCGRDTCVIALGGGVVTDLAGFVAATYQRGIPYVNIPTTLLGAADASIGGKTGVDTDLGKNQIGAFHYPKRVYIDTSTWQTLPEEQIRNGLAETIKHAVIADAIFFEYLENHAIELGREGAVDPEILLHLAITNVRIKQSVVQDDPLEQGKRAILNFGHTLGHALEILSGYAILHGAAVAIGMVFAARLGEHLGHTTPGTAQRLKQLLQQVGLPVDLPGSVQSEELIDCMLRDKKNRNQEIRLVFAANTGTIFSRGGSFSHPVDPDVLRSFLHF